MNTTATQTLCRDRFVGWPLSVLPGRDCDAVVIGTGWACPEHHAAAHAVYATLITDVPDERDVKARREAQAIDPEVRAAIADATAYLAECAARPEGSRLPDFIASLLHDPKYGTKWFRVTENMAHAVLRTRDVERSMLAERTSTPASQPRIAEVVAYLAANRGRSEFLASLASAHERWGRLTDRQYEAVIKNLDREAPVVREDGTTSEPVSLDGWYKVGDDVYKVQKAVHGSGNLYAKRLVVSGHGKATWEYAPGMVRRLSADQRLSVEDAAAFGRLYGICAVCGRTLTDESSIEAGIGPVCITRLGA